MFRKDRETRDKNANIHWVIHKARECQNNIYFCFIEYDKALTLWITTNYGKILKELWVPNQFTSLLRNLYADKETIIRIRHGITNWFRIGEEVCQGCILSHWLFNLYAEHIMWNARLDDSQAGIKIAKRNINNLRYTEDTTLIAESEE